MSLWLHQAGYEVAAADLHPDLFEARFTKCSKDYCVRFPRLFYNDPNADTYANAGANTNASVELWAKLRPEFGAELRAKFRTEFWVKLGTRPNAGATVLCWIRSSS